MIPKTIHYCWFGGNPLSELALKCIASWKKYCPEYEIKEWNESNYDISQNPYMHEAYQEKRWGFVPDYARLDIIYRHGGIYLDTDVELLRSLDDLLQEKAFMGCEAREAVSPGLGFGAEKGTQILADMMHEIYANRHFIDAEGNIDTTPSPRLNTEFLKARGLKLNGEKEKIDDELTVYPAEYFAPKDFKTGAITITEKTFSIHHYDASWIEPEDKMALKIRWQLRRYGTAGRVITWACSKFLGMKRHLRTQGLLGTIKYILKS